MKSTHAKLFASLLSLLMVLSLAACGGSSAPAASSAAPEAASAEPASEAAAPEIEDSLTICTAEPDASMEILLEGFKKLYPDCDVEVVYGSAGEMTSRIIAEADKPQCDVMFSGINACDGDSYEPYFEKYVSTHDGELIEDCRSNNGYYNYVIISPCAFYVNHDILDKLGVKAPTSYEDLLNPKLKGQIVTSDPNSSSAAWNNLSNILTVFGTEKQETWDYIDKLLANKLVITESSSTVFTSVTSGEYAVGLTYEGGAANQLRDGAQNCEIIFPSNGSGYIVTAGAIVKNCQHPNAAKAWIEYTTSTDGQSNWASQLGTTRVTNASAKYETEWLQDYSSIKWVTRDIDWLVKNKAAVLEKWNATYNKYN